MAVIKSIFQSNYFPDLQAVRGFLPSISSTGEAAKSLHEDLSTKEEDRMNIFNFFKKNPWLSIVFYASLTSITQAAPPEGVGTESKGSYGTMEKAQGMEKMPAFEEVDKNSDHYLTKNELKGYPSLLKHFDKVDAGEDGQLEEHEYENLLMENERDKGM